jgi:hypothetical protein
VLLLDPRQTGKTALLSRFPDELRVKLLLPKSASVTSATTGEVISPRQVPALRGLSMEFLIDVGARTV